MPGARASAAGKHCVLYRGGYPTAGLCRMDDRAVVG